MVLNLRLPTSNDIPALENAYNEPWEEDFTFLGYFESLAELSFEKYVELLPNLDKKFFLPDGHVPCSFLLAFNSNNEIVGRVSIRHELNEYLSKIGGHIGYGVVPSQRRKGYATEILKLSLSYIKQNLPQIKEALLTCNDDNIGSIKTIENNGGKFIGMVEELSLKTPKRKYLIKI